MVRSLLCSPAGPLCTGLAVLSSGLLASGAHAGLLFWNNAVGGAAATSGNWSPVQVPTSADDLTFNLLATYSVTWNASASQSLTQTYKRGTVTNSLSASHAIAGALRVGDANADLATMNLTTGTLTCNASSFVGDDLGSVGTLNVDDDDADLIIANASDLTVGNNGDATLNITGRGHVQVADQFIAGANSSSSPTILVSGFLASPPFGVSHLEVLGLSESRIGQGGDATMTVSSGALAEFAGDLVVANGSASNSSITVQTAGLLNARLVVDGDLFIGRNTSGSNAGVGTVTANAGGTVDVGDLLSVGNDIVGTGNLNINALGVVATTNMEVGTGGTLTLNGGTLTSDNAILNENGGVITGAGVINADIDNSATITPAGTGLTLNGVLSHTAASGINGTKIHFGPGGGYTGSGVCTADISGDAASVITATGTLSIGRNTAVGFLFNGDLNVGGNIVTLLDSNGAILGGETTLNSGRLECPAGIGLANGGAIRGDGLLVGNLTCSGILDPDLPSTTGGLITVQGNVLMNPTGQLHVQLNGVPGSSLNDRVNVSGTAVFDGAIHLDIAPSLVPQLHVGHPFILMNAAGGRTGEFDSITPTPLCSGLTIVLVYSSTAVIALVRPPDCDTNNDGQIGVGDLLAIIANWGVCGEPGQPDCPFDVDHQIPGGQRSIGVGDLLLVISHWGNCP